MKNGFRKGLAGIALGILLAFSGNRGLDARGMLSFSSKVIDSRAEIGLGIGIYRMAGTEHGGDRDQKSLCANIDLSYACASGLYASMGLTGVRASSKEGGVFLLPFPPGVGTREAYAISPATTELDTLLHQTAEAVVPAALVATRIERNKFLGGVVQDLSGSLKIGYTLPLGGTPAVPSFLGSFFVVGGFTLMSVESTSAASVNLMGYPSYVVSLVSPEVGFGMAVVSTENEGVGMSGHVEVLVNVSSKVDSFKFGGNYMTLPGERPNPSGTNTWVVAANNVSGKANINGQAFLASYIVGASVDSLSMRPIFRASIVPISYTASNGMYGALKLSAEMRMFKAVKYSPVLAGTGTKLPDSQPTVSMPLSIPLEFYTHVSFVGGFQL